MSTKSERYVHKATEAEALLWDGNNVAEVEELLGISLSGVVPDWVRNLLMKPGTWIVRSCPSEPCQLMSPDQFESNYVKVPSDPAPGAASVEPEPKPAKPPAKPPAKKAAKKKKTGN